MASQYIGNIGKVANGMVSVTAYGVLDYVTFPLLFKVYEPHMRLKPGDTYKTKPELAVEIIEELEQRGFQFGVVLADCVYGESHTFIRALEKRHLKYVLAIRFNHGAWWPAGSQVRELSWRSFDRVFSNGEKETRYIREIVFGWRRSVRFYLITIDPRTLPKDGTWFIMTNLEGKIEKTVGNTYGLRTWIESTFQDSKSRGWDWERSHVRGLDRVNRLLLVLFLLLWWLAHLAATCMHHGKRDRYDRADRRDKGIFRIGRLYLFDIERRNARGGNIQQCLLFRKDAHGWCFSLRF